MAGERSVVGLGSLAADTLVGMSGIKCSVLASQADTPQRVIAFLVCRQILFGRYPG